ncbi:MAG: type IV secretion system DNA-binding domain-containing protein [Candidatus Dojkabacteria bacterium]|nr:MAG: type IV secretion system DNA-binding domain-containing protein [Candidatus Dojkabacteria bacterium]
MTLFWAILFVFAVGFSIFALLYGRSRPSEEIEVFEEIRNPVMMQVLVPRENDKTPLAAEQMFASIHGIVRDSKKSLDMIAFEMVSTYNDGLKFYIVCPQHLTKFIEGQIYAQYPNANIAYVQDYTQKPLPATLSSGQPYQAFVTTGEVELTKDFIFPIKTFRSFEVDPLASITSAMSELKEGEEVWVQLIARPVSDYWQAESKTYISAIKEGKDPAGGPTLLEQFFKDMGRAFSTLGRTSADGKSPAKEVVKLAPGQDEELRQIEEKMLKPGFEIKIRIVAKSTDNFLSEQLLRDVVASFKQFTTAHLNSFTHATPEKTGEEIYNDYLKRHMPAEPFDIVNIEELASVFHLPNNSVETPNINWSRARKAEPPMNLPTFNDDVSIFAETDYRGERVEFGIKRADRRKHMYLLGKTGVGKSSTFKNMFISDILHGDGACFIDPHGQDIEDLLNYIPPNRMNDVVYFDPSDIDHPIGFNLLELDDPSQRDLVADGVVEVFKKQFGTSWGPRLQYILQNSVATVLEAQGQSILGVQRILIDNNYRKFILKQVKDPILLKFWEEEYAQMAQNSRLITEAVAPIQNKVGRFISSAVIRNIVGQVKSTIDLRQIMDEGKILLINLAQGKIGEESAALLGGMVISRLQSTAMSRVDIPEDERRDFFLFVDEFQNFATDSFAKILSEARKFRLNLVMTNQYIEQIPLTVRHAIFGNVGTLSSFVVSQSDAAILAHEFAPIFTAEDLVSLEAHSMYLKLSIDGMTSKPFSAKSLNYKDRLQRFDQAETIRAMSRERYGTDRLIIEDKIIRWANQKYSEKGNRSSMEKPATVVK